jgi:hypothetical protein
MNKIIATLHRGMNYQFRETETNPNNVKLSELKGGAGGF